MGGRRLDLQKPTNPGQKKKSFFFSSRPRIVNAFSNIPFLDSCNGAQTGHGTPERHYLKKAEWAADVWTSKSRPTSDRKKKFSSKNKDPESLMHFQTFRFWIHATAFRPGQNRRRTD